MLRGLILWGFALGALAAATAQVREVWRYEYIPSQDQHRARLERVLRLSDGGFLLLGWTQTDLNGLDALAIRLTAGGEVLWTYQSDGAGFEDAFVDAANAPNGQLWLLGRFTNADGLMQTQVHQLTQAGQSLSVRTLAGAPNTHLRPLRFGFFDELTVFAEESSPTGASRLLLFGWNDLSRFVVLGFRPWGVSYRADMTETLSAIGGTVASPTRLLDTLLQFWDGFLINYGGPARGFDMPVAIAPISEGALLTGYYTAIVSEGAVSGDDVVLLRQEYFGSIRWGYRYTNGLDDEIPESLAVDSQNRPHLLVKSVIWRGEPFERRMLRLLRFSAQGALQEDVELDAELTMQASGLVRVNAAGQRFVAVARPAFVARVGANGQYLWQLQLPFAFFTELFAESDGSVVVAGERILRDESNREVTGRLSIVKYAPSADINGDGCVDDADLLAALFAFGQSGANLAADLNGDGIVDDADLLTVLFAFGEGC